MKLQELVGLWIKNISLDFWDVILTHISMLQN